MVFLLDSGFWILDTALMKIGLAGYSGSGVTTLLALLSEDIDLVNKHGGPEVRAISVDDPRLDRLMELFQPKKLTPLQVDVVELGDLRPQEGGGLRKETLVRAAGLDALVLVLRGFDAPTSEQCRSSGELDQELESLMQEFAIADLMPVENRLERLGKEGKISSREAQLLLRLKNTLEEGGPIRKMDLDKEELRVLSGYNFLTLVPLIVITNLGSDCMGKIMYQDLADRCSEDGITYIETPALAEFEILEIPEEERAPFLADLGIAESARIRFIKALFSQLRLVTFFTVSEKEVRAWTVAEKTPAVKAAGKIHTDMGRGFIRAEVISVDECAALGGWSRAREAGKLRVEGKDYVLKDGEIFQVRFNV
jgi:ribosome-binding ATPase YchF (GTP1/OBG family)